MTHEAVFDKGSASSGLFPSFLPKSKLILSAQSALEKRERELTQVDDPWRRGGCEEGWGDEAGVSGGERGGRQNQLEEESARSGEENGDRDGINGGGVDKFSQWGFKSEEDGVMK